MGGVSNHMDLVAVEVLRLLAVLGAYRVLDSPCSFGICGLAGYPALLVGVGVGTNGSGVNGDFVPAAGQLLPELSSSGYERKPLPGRCGRPGGERSG